MKPCILFFALLMPLVAFASKFSYTDIPQKDGRPYYEFTVPAPGIEKNELFHRAQIFLAEYFKKSTPEVKIADKEDGILAAEITFFYNYLDNPNILNGKSSCLLYVKAGNGQCTVSAYDFTLYRKETEAYNPKVRVSYAGDAVMVGRNVWTREDEMAVYKNAANNNKRSLNMLQQLHICVQKLQEALTKKLKG